MKKKKSKPVVNKLTHFGKALQITPTYPSTSVLICQPIKMPSPSLCVGFVWFASCCACWTLLSLVVLFVVQMSCCELEVDQRPGCPPQSKPAVC